MRHVYSLLTRRTLLGGLLGSLLGGPEPPRYRVAVSDLMILKRQNLGALPLAHTLGADGVEVDMGGLGNRETFDNQLADPTIRRQYLDTARDQKLEICSLAMTGFFAQSFGKRDGVERMVQDCLDTAKQLDVKVVFLPFGIPTDLSKNPELRPAVVQRLKDIAPRAADAKVIVGIETTLDAASEVKLLDEIGSPFVRSYFNFASAAKFKRDISTELQTLGKDRICQIHCTNEDGVWLQDDKQIDLPRVRRTLDEMGWKGWLVLERSRRADDPRNVKLNFGTNAAYVKSIFQTENATK
jgi:L-ribulose-5-phosphate 3-epimerase